MGAVLFDANTTSNHKNLKHLLKKFQGNQSTFFAIDLTLLSLPHYEKVFNNDLPRNTVYNILDQVSLNSWKHNIQDASQTCYRLRNDIRDHSLANARQALLSVTILCEMINNFGWDHKRKLDFVISISFLTFSLKTDPELVETLFIQAQPNVPFPKHYKTPDTLGIAREIFETRNFSLMPVLADALQDLGADNTELIRSGKGYSNWALYHLRKIR